MVTKSPTGGVALALYQPDIPQNAGTLIRLAACLGLECHVVRPEGFRADDRSLRRAGLDYLDRAALVRHQSWSAFEVWRSGERRRLVLATTKAEMPYTDFGFNTGDIIMVGRESAGVPDDVHAAATAQVTIPMVAEMRSLNVAAAAAMVIGEALRQIGGFAIDHSTEPKECA